MRRKTVFTCIIILLIFLISVTTPVVLAQIPMPPCRFYGYVFVDGQRAPDGLTVAAVVAGVTVNATQTVNGTYGWPEKEKGSGYLEILSEQATQGETVEFDVQGTRADQVGIFENGGAKMINLTTSSAPHVVIDQAFVSHPRANLGSVQTVGFHARWGQNNSDVIQGLITANNTQHFTNATGWITFQVSSSTVERPAPEWIVSSVNCSGVTAYVQTAPIPSIAWDRIKIIDGGLTQDSTSPGETVTVWFTAAYEYDNSLFNDSAGTLYVNGSAMSWSTANTRWEQNFKASTAGNYTFIITGATDNQYGITAITDTTGAKILTVVDQPALTAPILYGMLAIIIIATGSAAIFLIRRRGYRLKVQKEPPKKPHPNRRMHTPLVQRPSKQVTSTLNGATRQQKNRESHQPPFFLSQTIRAAMHPAKTRQPPTRFHHGSHRPEPVNPPKPPRKGRI